MYESIASFPGCLVAIDPLPDWLIDWAGSTQSLLSSGARLGWAMFVLSAKVLYIFKIL
jgi:hypothetical protein